MGRHCCVNCYCRTGKELCILLWTSWLHNWEFEDIKAARKPMLPVFVCRCGISIESTNVRRTYHAFNVLLALCLGLLS